MKKALSLFLVLILALTLLFTSCAKSGEVKIAVPNDSTNEARALKLLEVQGIIKLKDTGDELATVRDIAENPYNVTFLEVEAAQIPSVLKDVTYAVINSNYAIGAGLTPFTTEGTDVSYPNIICVKDGQQNTDKTKALVAAIGSQKVKDYIQNTYKGAIVCDLGAVGDGYDAAVNYDALKGTKISIAASPTPHADILKIAKDVLAAKEITLDIKEYTDYVQPNNVVESGEVDANYFQHIPYLNDFNKENGTHIVSVLEVHHEPMGVYSATEKNWDNLKK
ncbi:MAG: hypothetical protein II192_05580 [Clostridia bacterium]|nr:hypothetical protein [Clostridia bacterium]MBQ4297847.1 hypothetical protein [Clostridia bacterium]